MKLNIAGKLIFLVTGTCAVGVALAGALLVEMQATAHRYDAVLNQPVRQIELARITQVTFKKQVQEWKNILLRGHNEADLATYTKNFHDDELDVLKQSTELAATVSDPQVRDLLDQFIRAHRALSSDYQAAFIVYTANFDFKAADRMVRGRDRAPTDLFDAVVNKLDADARGSIETQRASSRAWVAASLAGCALCLAALGCIAFLTVGSILRRLARLKQVADRLAVADVDGLIIDVSGDDEIGEFGESMQGVHAAIEELMNSLTFGVPVA
jgi:methyl-accepting chemotaxis protein